MPNRLLASRLGGRLWIALIEDGELCELDFERPANAVRQEQIYRARVTHVVPAIQSAFLDLGGNAEVFLHATELVLPGESPLALALAIRLEDHGRLERALDAGGFFGFALNGVPRQRVRRAAVGRRLHDQGGADGGRRPVEGRSG